MGSWTWNGRDPSRCALRSRIRDGGAKQWLPMGLAVVLLCACQDATRYSARDGRSIPMPMHLMLDVGAGLLLAASPWLFGFSGNGLLAAPDPRPDRGRHGSDDAIASGARADVCLRAVRGGGRNIKKKLRKPIGGLRSCQPRSPSRKNGLHQLGRLCGRDLHDGRLHSAGVAGLADVLDKRHLVENVFSLGHGAEPVAGIWHIAQRDAHNPREWHDAHVRQHDPCG